MNKILSFLTLGCIGSLFLFSSCSNPMTLETHVFEDGSLDKTIVFEEGDSSLVDQNIFGINPSQGWKTAVAKNPKEKEKYRIEFNKHFSSSEELNLELDRDIDTLFQIQSTFEKRFRWFYTYIKYQETYRPINRFKSVRPEEFFNEEDHHFIDRLPAEGREISKADSVFLEVLNIKIHDHYVRMGIFKEQYQILESMIKDGGLQRNWLDSLKKKEEYIYNQIEDDMKGDPEFAFKMADSLSLPIDKKKIKKEVNDLILDHNRRISFMSFSNDGHYTNIIHMPWTVIKTNADSVSGNTLYWRPLVTKFLFRDFTMTAESRKLNAWPTGISMIVVILTLVLFFRKRKSV